VVVTGGFFDGTASSYLGRVIVWRDAKSSMVKALTFTKISAYVPEKWPVINKGFAGASWWQGRLYVCWPNRVAVVDPNSNWNIVSHLDNLQFNDLHHVHVDERGMLVANTGIDAVDLLTINGTLVQRYQVAQAREGSQQATLRDLRGQAAHDELRGKDAEHVNFVSTDSASGAMHATFLQSKRVVRVDQPKTTVATLPDGSPPHEGFLAFVPAIAEQSLLWNSTVDGHIFATNPATGDCIYSWDLSEYADAPRGWTRGLCLLDDGFLVGCSVVRDSARDWLPRHGSSWNFDVEESTTAVVYIPFVSEPGLRLAATNVLDGASAKIFSLLPLSSKDE
jgi:hypothetical protein